MSNTNSPAFRVDDTYRVMTYMDLIRNLDCIDNALDDPDVKFYIYSVALWDPKVHLKLARRRKARNRLMIVDTFNIPDIAEILNSRFGTSFRMVATPTLFVLTKEGVSMHHHTYDIYRELGA